MTPQLIQNVTLLALWQLKINSLIITNISTPQFWIGLEKTRIADWIKILKIIVGLI